MRECGATRTNGAISRDSAGATRTVKLRAYAVSVKGSDWGESTIHALAASKARYRHWLHVREPWLDIKIMDINVRLIGAPRNTPAFEHTKKYRGVSFNIGDRVRVGDGEGFIVDRNDSANFQVLFLSGRWAGGEMNCHPSEIAPVAESAESARCS